MRSARPVSRWLASSLAALSVIGAGLAQARDPVAEGRAHLRKANALAGNDRCEAAIKEYTLAYDRLHDPVVLFNRAECYRRIGEDASATADYRAFLSAVPGAPNRAEIEAKIGSGGSAGSVASGQPAPHITAPPPARAVAPAPVTPPKLTQSGLAPPPNLTPAPAPAPPPAAADATASLVAASAASDTPAPTPAPADSGHAGNAWLWAALGAAVAGGAVGAYLVLRTPGASVPSTELGNYRF